VYAFDVNPVVSTSIVTVPCSAQSTNPIAVLLQQFCIMAVPSDHHSLPLLLLPVLLSPPPAEFPDGSLPNYPHR
jgi:hypothetical protein